MGGGEHVGEEHRDSCHRVHLLHGAGTGTEDDDPGQSAARREVAEFVGRDMALVGDVPVLGRKPQQFQ